MPTSSAIQAIRTYLSSRDGDGILSWDLHQDLDCTAYGTTARSVIPFAALTLRHTAQGLLMAPSFEDIGCKTYRCVAFSNGRVIRFEDGLRGPVPNLFLLLNGVLVCDFMAMGAIALRLTVGSIRRTGRQPTDTSPDRLLFLAQQPRLSVFGVDSVELQSRPPDTRTLHLAPRQEPSKPYRASMQCMLSFRE